MIIDIIGKGKLISLCVLCVVAAMIWFGTLGYFHSHYAGLEDTYSQNMMKTSNYNENIEKMTEIVSIMRKRGQEYFIISDKAIDQEQNRLIARRHFQTVRLRSDVPFIDYKINQEKIINNSFINERGYDLNQSIIEVNIDAYTAKDIFLFSEDLKNSFDGLLVLESFTINKKDASLQGMSLSNDIDNDENAGNNLSGASRLVLPRLETKLFFLWNTLTKRSADSDGLNGDFEEF